MVFVEQLTTCINLIAKRMLREGSVRLCMIGGTPLLLLEAGTTMRARLNFQNALTSYSA